LKLSKNGHLKQSDKYNETKRLGTINRLKRCVPTCTIISKTPSVSQILHSRQLLSMENSMSSSPMKFLEHLLLELLGEASTNKIFASDDCESRQIDLSKDDPRDKIVSTISLFKDHSVVRMFVLLVCRSPTISDSLSHQTSIFTKAGKSTKNKNLSSKSTGIQFNCLASINRSFLKIPLG
jgi:hypothetical protein